MSRIFDLYKQIEEEKEKTEVHFKNNKDKELSSQTVEGESPPPPRRGKPMNKRPQTIEYRKTPGVSRIFMVLLFLALVGFNVQFFLVMEEHSSKMDMMLGAINNLKESFSEDKATTAKVSRGLQEMGDDVAMLQARIEAMDKKNERLSRKVAYLEDVNTARNIDIETLNQAKNTLFREQALLEVEMERLTEVRE